MGSQTHKAKAMHGLGRLLRADSDGIARYPLPDRWLELMNCIDEKERFRLKAELDDAGSIEMKEWPTDLPGYSGRFFKN